MNIALTIEMDTFFGITFDDVVIISEKVQCIWTAGGDQAHIS
jgi:hypothetical protein